jgi:hypothetical protein
MSNDKLIENLKKLSGEHEKHLSDIREKIRKLDAIPKAKALVGKCFKYRNSGGFMFSSSRHNGWVFKRVVTAIGENVLVDSFTVEGPNHIEFTFASSSYASSFSHTSLVPISKKVYDRQFNRMIKALVQMNRR